MNQSFSILYLKGSRPLKICTIAAFFFLLVFFNATYPVCTLSTDKLVKFHYENSNGLQIKGEISKHGVPADSIVFSYSDDKKLIFEFWDFNNKWNQTFLYKYKKNDQITKYAFTSPDVFIPHASDCRVTIKNHYFNPIGGLSFSGRLVKKYLRVKNG